ncbi:MAG: hypothetical protein AB7Q42_14950 [Acidimicrobiia bacterium]
MTDIAATKTAATVMVIVAATTATMTDRHTGIRLLAGGAGLLVALGVVGGCSGDESPRADSATELGSTVIQTAPTSVAVEPATTPAPTPAPTTPAVDGGALLQQALDALAAGYHFTTTVTVDGVVTLIADGDRVADGTRLNLTGDGGTISYVITPAGSWVLPDGGEWEAVEAAPAAVDPITALRTPAGITVDGVEGTVTRLTATVPPNALGIAGDTAAVVQLLLDSATLRDITYATSVDGRPASVQATISPLTDPTPVTAPA